jgi:hypothetical protein
MVGGKNISKDETITSTNKDSTTGTTTSSDSSTSNDVDSVSPSSSTEKETVTTTTEGVKDEFTIAVQPNDGLSSLHEKIEQATGLSKCQQRLIYRGRILNAEACGSEPSDSGSSGNSSDSGSSTPQEERQDKSDTVAVPTKKEVMIGDIAGLTDGQTIHLVPRPLPPLLQEEQPQPSNNATMAGPMREARIASATEMSGAGGLLAALLGLGSSLAATPTTLPREMETGTTTANANVNTNQSEEDLFLDPSQVLPLRPPRRARRRPNAHRLSVEDPTHPTPGPLEPVRQSLMTLHTMIDATSTTTTPSTKATNLKKDTRHPLQAQRTWYKGQWIDCRDTVHQWLEATIVDIKHPREILTPAPTSDSKEPSVISYIPAISTANSPRQMQDPAIGANDDQGRLRLLLEPSSHAEDSTLSDLNDFNPTMVGWRERSNNEHVQLLLVHYNGWPDRWDEWIRSDSERIRPFRTRSKPTGRGGSDQSIYGNTRVNCPVPCSSFSTAPTTFVVGENEELEGVGVLKELQVLFDDVQSLLQDSVPKHTFESLEVESSDSDVVMPLTEFEITELYSALSMLGEDDINDVFQILDPFGCPSVKQMSVNDIDIASLEASVQRKLQIYLNCGPVASNVEKEGAEDVKDTYLPWDDDIRRRSLQKDPIPTVDNESEVAKEDDSDDEDTIKKTDNKALEMALSKIDKDKLTALAPLLDRLGRVLTDIAPHVAAIAEKLPEPAKKLTGPRDEVVEGDAQPVEKNDGEFIDETIEEGEEARTNDGGEEDEDTDEGEKELQKSIKRAISKLGGEAVEGDEDETIVLQSASRSEDDKDETTHRSNIPEEGLATEDSGRLRSIFDSNGDNRELRSSWSASNDSATVPLLAEEIIEEISGDTNEGNQEHEIDPDYVDFVNGFINVSDSSSNARRSVRRGGSAYLASTSD